MVTLLFLAISAPASAQPAVPPPLPALDMETDLHESSESSCSRSSATTNQHTELRLVVSGAGAATLTLSSRESHRTGPSFAAFRMGQRDWSEVHELKQRQWNGQAQALVGGGFRLRFRTGKVSEVRWSGPGSLPLPKPRRVRVDLTMECTPESLTLQPSVASTQPASQLPGYLCRLTAGATPLLRALSADGIPFAPGTPLRRETESGPFGHGPELRRR